MYRTRTIISVLKQLFTYIIVLMFPKNTHTLILQELNSIDVQAYMETGGVQSELVLRHIAYCILKALQHIHSHRYVNRQIYLFKDVVCVNNLYEY